MAGRKPELKRSFSIIPCFVFVELVILAAVVLLAYQLEYTDTFPVHVQGFFCYDSTYAKPYPGPEEASRAPPVLVYSLVTAGPTLTILMGEMAFAFFPSGRREEKTIISGDCCYFSPALRRLVRFLGVYSFGLFTTTIFANAGQVVTGNPTPHFLSVCRPNYTALGCQPPTAHYVTDLGACAGNPLLVTAARKAFPSKDAALCAYAVVYTVVTCVVNKFQSQRPAGRRGALPESLGTKPTMALPCVDSPLEKLSVAQDPSSPTPLLQPVCHTPPTSGSLSPAESQSCVRSGHLIPSCVSSRGPPMCSSPRARSRAKSEPSQPPPPSQSSSQPQPQPQPQLLSPGHGGAGGGGRGRKMLLPTPLLRDFYTLSGLYPSPFHRDSFSPYLFASRDHLL
ncbi:phospholipid phosphatase-related protein type 2 isoform X5 [Tachyglossus aculeatus]|uniref:phospholipid phosphatase-related protein type 2 isoform X5 n=1 Tax=Tachyglossus aculeatus TaxID=9261 RepID=UPI0018F321B7|nr:phospholipid phosphatase-related protein type 2 isoform X5 [Tachyglossus aculeatus]